MNPGFPRFVSLSLVLALLVILIPVPAYANSLLSTSPEAGRGQLSILQITDTPTTPLPTETSAPTETAAPIPVLRPQIAVQNYRTKPENVQNGQNFTLIVKLRNEGEAQAFNVQASFTSTDFVPLKNGGVNIIGDLVLH